MPHFRAASVTGIWEPFSKNPTRVITGIGIAFFSCLCVWSACGCATGVHAHNDAGVVIDVGSSSEPPVPSLEPPVPLKDTAYPVPSGAIFVSLTGNDANPGTESAPLRTIAKAADIVPRGGAVVIRQGIYREAIGGFQKTLTLQPYPHERVWVEGSVMIPDWTKEGTIWRKDNWTYKFQRFTLADDPYNIDPAYRLAGYPDQVFVDGKPLTLVPSKAEVGAGTFFVDYSSNQLYIGDDPTGRLVEGSAQKIALSLQYGSDGSVVRGLGFVHFAPNEGLDEGPAAVIGNASRLVFENNTFAYNSNRGLASFGSDAVIRGNTFIYNGKGGLDGYGTHRTLVEDNYVGHNNTRHFKVGSDANGGKFAASNSVIWRKNLVEYNLGGGLWCDSECWDNVFVNNIVRYNGLWNGIFIEKSHRGIIASNLIYGNDGTGISFSAEGVKVYNNTLSNNGVNFGIDDCAACDSTGSDIVVKNNIISNISYTLNGNYGSLFTAIPLTQLDYNAYYRSSSAHPQEWLVNWADSPYGSLATFRQGINQEAHGIGIDDQTPNPFFVDEANGDYHLKAGSPSQGTGEPLPQDVAEAIGVTAGVPVDKGALLWLSTLSTTVSLPQRWEGFAVNLDNRQIVELVGRKYSVDRQDCRPWRVQTAHSGSASVRRVGTGFGETYRRSFMPLRLALATGLVWLVVERLVLVSRQPWIRGYAHL